MYLPNLQKHENLFGSFTSLYPSPFQTLTNTFLTISSSFCIRSVVVFASRIDVVSTCFSTTHKLNSTYCSSGFSEFTNRFIYSNLFYFLKCFFVHFAYQILQIQIVFFLFSYIKYDKTLSNSTFTFVFFPGHHFMCFRRPLFIRLSCFCILFYYIRSLVLLIKVRFCFQK